MQEDNQGIENNSINRNKIPSNHPRIMSDWATFLHFKVDLKFVRSKNIYLTLVANLQYILYGIFKEILKNAHYFL